MYAMNAYIDGTIHTGNLIAEINVEGEYVMSDSSRIWKIIFWIYKI